MRSVVTFLTIAALSVGILVAADAAGDAQIEILKIKQTWMEATRTGASIPKETMGDLRFLVAKHAPTIAKSNSLETVAIAAIITTYSKWVYDIPDGWWLGRRLRELQAADSGNNFAETAVVRLHERGLYVEDPTKLFAAAIADIDAKLTQIPEDLGTEQRDDRALIESAKAALDRLREVKEQDRRTYSGRPKYSQDYKTWLEFDANYSRRIAALEDFLTRAPSFPDMRSAKQRMQWLLADEARRKPAQTAAPEQAPAPAADAKTAPAQEQPAAAGDGKGAFCTGCGAKSQGEAKFCTHCGGKLK